jgi:putative nucleotidyltransferase with HDIG domain
MNSLKIKLLGLMTAIVILIITASGIINFHVQRNGMVKMAESSNAILTDTIRNSIAGAMGSGQAHDIPGILGRLRTREVITALRIVDEDGRVLASADTGEVGRSVETPAPYTQTIGDSVPLHRTEAGTYQSLVPIHNSPACHTCHPASLAVLGYLQSELSLQQLDTLIGQQKNSALLSALIIIALITITISAFLVTYVDRPIQRLVDSMQSVEQGDLDTRAAVTSSTEMRLLSENFNLMVERLKRLMETTVRNERDLARAQEKLSHHHEIYQMNQRLEGHIQEIETLNGSLEERLTELEIANFRISDLAGELEIKNDSLEKAVSRLSTLYKVGLAINSTTDQNAVMNLIVRTALRTLNGQAGYILIKDPLTGRLSVASLFVSHDLERSIIADQFPDMAISSRVLSSRRPFLMTDLEGASPFTPSSPGHERRTLICAPLISKDEILGTITIVNRQDGGRFDEEDLELLSTIAAQAGIAIHNAQLYETQQSTYISTIHALVSAVEASDSYLRGHSERVTSYSLKLAGKLNLPPERLRLLERAAILHDIGKIGINLSLLHKTSPLTQEEMAILQEHPSIGMRILEPIEFLQDVRSCIGQHHERFDGTGYPCRLDASELMLEARILAIADAYDAMTSDRPYRSALSHVVAIRELQKQAGTQFDPDLVPHFVELASQGIFADLHPASWQPPEVTAPQGLSHAI